MVHYVMNYTKYRYIILSDNSRQSVTTYHVTADSTSFAAVPVRRESGSTRFSPLYCSYYQAVSHHIYRRRCKYFLSASRHVSHLKDTCQI
jgi:hypothetical protein